MQFAPSWVMRTVKIQSQSSIKSLRVILIGALTSKIYNKVDLTGHFGTSRQKIIHQFGLGCTSTFVGARPLEKLQSMI